MSTKLRTDWVGLADKIHEATLTLIDEHSSVISDSGALDPRVVGIQIASRSLSISRSIWVLLGDDQVVEARILLRANIENALWIAGLLAGADEFVSAMMDDDIGSMRSRGRAVLDRLGEDTERLRQHVEDLGARWPGAKMLKPQQVAANGDLNAYYPIYQQVSADAGHPTFTSLRRFISIGEEGSLQLLVDPPPSDKELFMTCDWACMAMLAVAAGLNDLLNGTAGQQLTELTEIYQTLMRETKAQYLEAGPTASQPPGQ